MRCWLFIGMTVIFFTLGACAHVPVQQDQGAKYIAEYEDLLAHYEQFNSFKDDAAFLSDGFVEDSSYLQWLLDVQSLQKKPGYAPEGSRMLTILAMAYRQEGQDSFIYQQIEQSFAELLDNARIEQDASMVILYTGDTSGKLLPLKRGEVFSGGLARRAAMVNTLRERERHVLVLDAGDTFLEGESNLPINEAMIQAMNTMGYDAMGLGPKDLDIREQDLKKLLALAQFPIICSNLVFDADSEAWIAPHAVVESAHKRIGVLSIIPPDVDSPIQDTHFIDPREAIDAQIRLLQGKVDNIILVTQYDALEIATILDPDDPIVVVFSDAQGGALDTPKYIFPTVADGLGLGFFRLVVSESGQLAPAAQNIINLVGSEEDQEILDLVKDFK